MAVAFVQEFDVGEDRSTSNYDAMASQLKAMDPAEGLILHTAGFTPDNVFRVFAVWESGEDLQRFVEERLMPMVEQFAGDDSAPPPDRQYTYDLHDIHRL